ncbi:SCO6745 family protein [Phycicoccus avicenniae]|uniref:SCO6745 family protein n=1 Tax=Phycicoccus avicenniae TaxID=2828860 RepID=UPI003D26F6AE
MSTFRHDESARALARLAYRTLEPYHLTAYFGPHVDAAREELGIGWLGAYTGMRAAPLGVVPGEVVAATFFGFRPDAVVKAWGLALGRHTPAELDEVRTRCLDTGLRAALGPDVDSPELVDLVGRLRPVLDRLDHGGRPLAAAFAAQDWPAAPHLALWHASALWREWRGDGHVAALTAAGLRPLESLVLYDAWLRATSPERASRGRPFLQPTRRWTDEEWAEATEALCAAGLLAPGADEAPPALTDAGRSLRDHLEDATDDASAAAWADIEDADGLLASARPFVKKVIDAGWLPGTPARR